MKKAIAEAVLERDGGRCQYPLGGRGDKVRKCGSGHVELHHRRIRGQLGQDTAENLIALCKTHHMYVHAHPAESQKNGLLLKHGDSQKRKPWMDVTIPEDGY